MPEEELIGKHCGKHFEGDKEKGEWEEEVRRGLRSFPMAMAGMAPISKLCVATTAQSRQSLHFTNSDAISIVFAGYMKVKRNEEAWECYKWSDVKQRDVVGTPCWIHLPPLFVGQEGRF